MGTDNTEDIVKQSDNKYMPPEGFNKHPENINRNGRPKKGLTLTDIAKEILEEEIIKDGKPTGRTRKEALIRRVADLAYEGNETMIKLLWNYVDGLPKERVEIEGKVGHYITQVEALKLLHGEVVEGETDEEGTD